MPETSTSRRWEIDAVRGLMLVLMTVTHLPTRLTMPLGQPFGFVSAAEGFVLLSAYMAGMVYGRTAARRGIPAMRQAFLRRATKIYACQAATLLFLFTVITFIGIRVDEPAIKGLITFYLAKPIEALVGGLLLVYEPPLLDILPIYVLFMLASPWVMSAGLRRGWAPVLAVSTALWFLAQFGLSKWFYDAIDTVISNPIPFHETGTFSMWGWQFLWVLGLWMGASRNDPEAPHFVFPRWAIGAAAAIAVAGFCWRHAIGQVPFGDGLPEWNLLFDKWQLGPLRVLNLFALLVLAIRFGPPLAARMPRPRWLETLGAASLPVFCAHLVVVLLAISLMGARYDRPWWQDIALLAVCFAALHAMARVSLWWDKGPDEDAPGAPRKLLRLRRPLPPAL
ncbi:acyltransferase [Paracidovorax avenae]|uniref:OpgC domain-containing protein n=1 Tax=Paracidovorax avenae TaxID=80867 RepID=UPI000D152907|nr:OpgC domain-containing protein [Paracidovorax avenae]AVS89128.1 acyltransferase [Paracidovorax avenae]